MSRSARHLVAALSLFLASPLLSAEPDSTVEKLNAEITRSLATMDKNDRNVGYETERIVSTFGRVQKAIERSSIDEAQQTLAQLAVMKLSPAAKELINRLQTELPQLVEARQKQFAASVNAVVEKTGAVCLKSEKEGDLSDVAAEIATLRRTISSGYSSEIQTRLAGRLDAASRFVTRWQEFLAQKANGYEDSARNILRELADSPQGIPVVPREKLLAKLATLETGGSSVQAILAGVKSLDDLPKALSELQKLRQSDRRGYSTDGMSPVNDLTRMNAAWAAAKNGQYSSAISFVTSPETSPNASTPELLRIESMLFSAVLPRFLALPDNPQPKPGENSSEFLLRLADDASTKGDWDRLRRVLEAYRIKAFSTRGPSWLDADITGCTAFLTAQNLEKAGRLGPAILAYQRVLRSPGKYSPVAQASQRLEALQKEKTAEFNEAARQIPLQEAFESAFGQRF
ncbi:hypothetical protein ACXR0O_17440 [Verrucomicrobiota bacterium sgz303538]